MNPVRYIYFTDNIERMAAFYRDVLGMTVLNPPESMSYEQAGWVQLSAGQFEVALHKATKPGLSGRSRNKLVFAVKDVTKHRDELKARKVKVGKIFGDGQVQLCDFKDPDGNLLQISTR